MDSKTLLTRPQFAALLDVHVRTVDRFARTKAGFPQPIDLGPHCVRYNRDEAERWMAQCK